MADTQNPNPFLNLSKKDLSGNRIAENRAILIKDGIENGTAPFLPRMEAVDDHTFVGRLNPQVIYNANTGMPLNSRDLIPALLVKNKNGYESNAVGTFGTAQKAGTAIKKDEKGLDHMFQGADGQYHSASYFFPEQTEQPERLQEFAQKNQKWQQRLSNETIKIESPAVDEYLGAFVAACKSGAAVEVSPQVAADFQKNILAVADNELKRSYEKNPDIPPMSKIFFSADLKATEIIKTREKELGIGQEQSQKPHENKRQRNQGMER